jgi:hypothetical protein
LCAVSLDVPGNWPAGDLREVSLLVVSNNFRPAPEDIQQMPQLKVVVADGTNNNATIRHLAGLSRKFGFALHNTRNSGAFTLELQ